jgi:hypothetical protein
VLTDIAISRCATCCRTILSEYCALMDLVDREAVSALAQVPDHQCYLSSGDPGAWGLAPSADPRHQLLCAVQPKRHGRDLPSGRMLQLVSYYSSDTAVAAAATTFVLAQFAGSPEDRAELQGLGGDTATFHAWQHHQQLRCSWPPAACF